MVDEAIQFEEGETYEFQDLPDNEMNESGKLEWVDDGVLALSTPDGQLVEFEWSHVRCKDVSYLTEDGDIVEYRP